MKKQEIHPSFRLDDDRAVESIEFKRSELARAIKLSPALVASLEAEIDAAELSLDKARRAGLDFAEASTAAERAELVRQRAVAEHASSHDVDEAAADRIVHALERTKYLASAHARRAAAAHTAVTAAYQRAMKEINERNAAVRYAERLAGQVIDRDPGRIELETRPGVIAWLRLVFPVEGRDFYASRSAYRAGNRSYPEPPPIEDFDDACRSFFAQIESLRDQAARQATELAAVST
ncbi:MAG: hypothetical protein ABUL60_29505 [Myxococcales bacterium]